MSAPHLPEPSPRAPVEGVRPQLTMRDLLVASPVWLPLAEAQALEGLTVTLPDGTRGHVRLVRSQAAAGLYVVTPAFTACFLNTQAIAHLRAGQTDLRHPPDGAAGS